MMLHRRNREYLRVPMRPRSWLTVLTIFLALAPPGVFAGPAVDLPIDAEALPARVRPAWLDVLLVAPAAEHWTDKWRGPEPREEVAATLARALKALQAESMKSPDDVEVLLATGITGRLAHNLDVPGAPEAGVKALEQAGAKAPRDPRPRWQLGANHCEVGDFVAMMRQLDAAEKLWSPIQPPPAFWRTSLECFHLANMPAHVLRAAAELRRTGALTGWHETLVGRAKDLLVRPDPASTLSVDEAHRIQQVGEGERLVNLPCGFAVPIVAGSSPRVSPIRNGTCFVQIELGPYPGKTGEVFPSISVLARPARANEKIQDFLDELHSKREPSPTGPCPAGTCLGFEIPMPRSYGHEGGGVGVAVALERDEPRFPSLPLEWPSTPPRSTTDGTVKYFAMVPRPTRFSGRLFYVVFLDTARSVEPKARAEFKRVLDGMVIE